MAETSQRATTLWASIEQAQALLGADPSAAEARAREILNETPGQQQALGILVAAHRRLATLTGVRQILEALSARTPQIAAIHFALALVLEELDDRAGSIAELSRALELAPLHPQAREALIRIGKDGAAGYPDSWQALENTTDLKRRETAARGPEDGLPGAEALFRQWLEVHPTDAWALQMLGNVFLRLRRYDECEAVLERALDLAPDFSGARWMLCGTFFYRGNWERALAHVENLLKVDPERPEYLHLKAHALLHSGDVEAAITCHELLLAQRPAAESWTYYGQALRAAGRQRDAIAAYRRAIAIKPDFGLAWWGLADLKTFEFGAADVEAMKAVLERPDLKSQNRARIHFALGKAFEDERRFDVSFAHYDRANALVREYTKHDCDAWTNRMRASKRVFTDSYFRERVHWGSAAEEPIFIVGLPRSGTTLVEQILASHSQVESGGEVQALEWVATQLTHGGHYPERLRTATAEDVRSGADAYLAMTGSHRRSNRRFFVDKMPNNFDYLGLILLMFPKARIIDARRHPLGSGFAIFKHYLTESYTFAFGLSDIGSYYRNYVELMEHFDAVAPARVHRVLYENMVSNTEREIRSLLDYCGLPFEDECLRFHESKRAVLTPSSEQVRRPIYAGAAELWRNYEAWLGPLKSVLGDVLEAWPAVPKFAAPSHDDGQWRVSFATSNAGFERPASRRLGPGRDPSPRRS